MQVAGQIPSMEDISQCANLIWDSENRPEGSDKIHWCEAEAQLLACHAYDHWMIPLPAAG
jgi:hypothetical protein